MLIKKSFIELRARERAKALLDSGSFRELLGPFDFIESPWLEKQNIVPQADDGMVIAKGTFGGKACCVAAIEGAFQGGSMGEVSGAKMAAMLELALEDAEAGNPPLVILCLETGGVRLQEANLGLAAIADIHSAIAKLRRHTPVVGLITGTVGCFGGMSIAAGLCSYLVVTKEARLGLNGPQVIEQEAGITEYDSKDKPFIWSMTGGEIRYETGFADELAVDDVDAVRTAIAKCFAVKVAKRCTDFNTGVSRNIAIQHVNATDRALIAVNHHRHVVAFHHFKKAHHVAVRGFHSAAQAIIAIKRIGNGLFLQWCGRR